MWTSPTALLLLAVSLLRGTKCASAFVCPRLCRCLPDTIRCNNVTQGSPLATDHRDTRLFLYHLSFTVLSSHSFDGLKGVHRIEISQSLTLQTIQTLAINDLPNLTEISIQNTRSLVHIGRRAFNNLPKLRYLSISNTGITAFPDLTSINTLELEFILDICDNLYLPEIPSNAFNGMIKGYVTMNMYNNGFGEIHDHAFNATQIDKLVLKNNRNLRVIHRDAFRGATGPAVLDVSATALTVLPAYGLESVLVLLAQSTPALKRLPPLQGLWSLREAHLTYKGHCCALRSWNTHHRNIDSHPAGNNGSTYCDESEASARVQHVIGGSSDSILTQDTLLFSDVDVLADSDAFGDVNFHYPELDLCKSQPNLVCTPEADAFNPCEDITGFTFLRAAIWFISILAIMGNLTVLMVSLTSRKLMVPRFLICHLAFADLCIGVYLLMIAIVDLRTHGHYSHYAIEWQTGPGCSVAGFLSVFGAELSVYTLSAITLERWHTITNAMQAERRMGLRQAATVMATGWLVCLGMGLLPLAGVSSYAKVSMCLPMDIDTPLAQVFIIVLLLFNVGAFIIVCICYVLIYLALKSPDVPRRNADTKIAKRMAVLIFTDFLCMAPISFFAISAAFKVPLITVTNSKILLVLFFPINSCANPFLYAIFTRAFRKDAYQCVRTLVCSRRKISVHCMENRCKRSAMKKSFATKSKDSGTGLRMNVMTVENHHLKQEG